MTKAPPPGYHLEMGLWAVELVIFAIFAARCMPSLGGRSPWISSRLVLVFVSLIVPLSIAWMRLAQFRAHPSIPDVPHVQAKLGEIEDLFVAGTCIFSVMLVMHSLAWWVGRLAGHKTALSDKLPPSPHDPHPATH
jgi:hypothetical protein